jgi:protein-S-isoprenylcysteine O-methyltransferase Ste14
MRALHRLAIVVLILEMPVPFYWLVLHGGVGFWRKRKRLGYLSAVLLAWGAGGGLLYHFRAHLFPELPFAGTPSLWTIVLGLLLIAADALTLATVEKELGGRRLVGHAELTGRGDMTARGLYRWVRHPRYLGMILAVLGACLLGGSQALWIAFGTWLAIVLAMIVIEDRELRVRFGPAYVAYAKQVPALLPVRRAPRC